MKSLPQKISNILKRENKRRYYTFTVLLPNGETYKVGTFGDSTLEAYKATLSYIPDENRILSWVESNKG